MNNQNNFQGQPGTGFVNTGVGAPLTNLAHNLQGQPGVGQLNPGMGAQLTNLTHNLQGQPGVGQLNPGMGAPVTNVMHTMQGQPGVGLVNPGFVQQNVLVPVETLPHGLQQVAGGPTGLAQTSHGQMVGTVPTSGVHGPAHGTKGLAGESYAVASNVADQGNVVHAPVGTLSGLTQTNVTPTHNVPGNTTAQGQFTFRPMEGRFVRDKDPITKMDPYVKVKLGWHRGKTAVAKSQGTNPVWNDAITLARKHNETFAKLTVKDKDRVSKNDRLGEVKINLDEAVQRGKFSQWYPVTDRKGVPSGEILVEVEYAPVFIH